MKRYVAEPGTDLVRKAMDGADRRVISRIGYVETLRAVTRAAGPRSAAARNFLAEWPLLDVVELDEAVADSAARLALEQDLRTLDAIHLASALALPPAGLAVASWDARLRAAAHRRGLATLPDVPSDP